jgi:hypothetical protein
MQKGTRVKVIDEQACQDLCANVRNGDKGTVLFTSDRHTDVCFDKHEGKFEYIVLTKALKRLHVKKVEV